MFAAQRLARSKPLPAQVREAVFLGHPLLHLYSMMRVAPVVVTRYRRADSPVALTVTLVATYSLMSWSEPMIRHRARWALILVCLVVGNSTAMTPFARGENPKMAVVDFDVLNFDATQEWGRSIGELVRNDKRLHDQYVVVDGVSLRTCCADNDLRFRGCPDEQTCRRLAEVLDADVVVTGTALQYGKTIRVQCAVFEAASRSAYLCRDVFVDECAQPHERTAVEVVNAVLTAREDEDKRWITPIVHDEFASAAPDESAWLYRHRATFGPHTPGVGWSNRDFADGQYRVYAERVTDRGYTSTQYVWLAAAADLRGSDDYIIDLTLSAQGVGNIRVFVALDEDPEQIGDQPGEVLYERAGMTYHPLLLPATRVRILVSGWTGLATSYSDSQIGPERIGLDLTELRQWRLRIAAQVTASAGSPRGWARVNVDEVHIVRVASGSGLRGRIVDAATQHTISEVGVRVAETSWTCRTDPAGLFDLPCPVGPWPILTESPRYKPISQSLAATTPDAEQERSVLALERLVTSLRNGDVIATISLHQAAAALGIGDFHPQGFLSADENRLYFGLGLTDSAPQLCLVSMALDGTQPSCLSTLPIATALEVADRTTYVFGHFPGTLYRLLPDGELDVAVDMQEADGVSYVSDLAYDGEYLWYVENDAHQRTNILGAIDLRTNDGRPDSPAPARTSRHVDTTSYRIVGIACDRKQARFWVSSTNGSGEVYELDMKHACGDAAITEGSIRNRFSGRYGSLAFADGSLWGYDERRQEICRIYVE